MKQIGVNNPFCMGMRAKSFLIVAAGILGVLGLLVGSSTVRAQDGYSIFNGTMADMTWPEVEQAAKDKAIVLLPTGVIEEHGPHLALGTDTYMAYTRCKLIKGELEKKGIKTIIAPPFYWGINHASGAFPGSFSSRPETVKAVIYDILSSIKRWGFENVFVVNNHGDFYHNRAIIQGVKEAWAGTGIKARYIMPISMGGCIGIYNSSASGGPGYSFTGQEDWMLFLPPLFPGPAPQNCDIHAGNPETSYMTYYFPQLVDAEKAKKLSPSNTTAELQKKWAHGFQDAREVTPAGYVGDPAAFDAAAGKKITEAGARGFANAIENCLKGTYVPPKP